MPEGVPQHRDPGPHQGAARLGASELAAFNRFPDDNPNPVLRFDDDGHLLYANPSSAPVRRSMGVEVGDRLPPGLLERFRSVAADRGFIELTSENRTFAVWPVPIPDLAVTNLYGTDVTAERAIVKFPDSNPNPVFRIDDDGRLVYANPASRAIVDGLGLRLGQRLPEAVRVELLERVGEAAGPAIEIEALGRRFALVPVDVPGFGFINVYGTDVTAVRENERLARENERLLLNVLPEPIARRLREGEPLIADRFEDVTLMFADIVEFTRLSSGMSPSELVTVLNEVFTVFDTLVDRHGLEKVKTIGDAYMVVGGIPHPAPDDTLRVVGMAGELAEQVGRIHAARRHRIAFRIGIHRGPVVAGVIGTRKFIYDVWGDTVNLASRMESHGVPGRVQVTQAVVDRVGGAFAFDARGLIDVKGKGPTPAFLLRADGA